METHNWNINCNIYFNGAPILAFELQFLSLETITKTVWAHHKVLINLSVRYRFAKSPKHCT